MTIEQTDKVDGMGIDTGSDEVVLIISDHLEWRDQGEHFSRLEEKIGSYINFIHSGQLEEVMPQSRDLSVRIKLVHQYEPTLEAKRTLDSIARQLSEMSYKFSYESLPSGY